MGKTILRDTMPIISIRSLPRLILFHLEIVATYAQ